MNNSEIDSFDKYFFQIIPPILINEILGDLSKESEDPRIIDKMAGFSYRISGNRGLTINHHDILINSLMGNEISMDGRFVPAGERIVRSKNGVIGSKVETLFEDKVIARWERKNFTNAEKLWAITWRNQTRNIYSQIYINKIEEVGLQIEIPKTYEKLVEIVDSLLQERKFQRMLFFSSTKNSMCRVNCTEKLMLGGQKWGNHSLKILLHMLISAFAQIYF